MAQEPARASRFLRISAVLLLFFSLSKTRVAAGREVRQFPISSQRPRDGSGSGAAKWARGLASQLQQQALGRERCPKVSKELLAARARKNTVMFAVVRKCRACLSCPESQQLHSVLCSSIGCTSDIPGLTMPPPQHTPPHPRAALACS